MFLHAGHEHLFQDPRAAANTPIDPAGAAVLRVNAGGLAFVDSAGVTWSPDTGFSRSKRVRARFAVGGTDDDLLYSNRRQGNFTFSHPAPDGAYRVTLAFTDTMKKAGKRLFNVDVEGQRVETNLDVFARTGVRRMALVVAHEVTVSGGTLDVAFTGVKGKAVVSAIALTPLPTPPGFQPDPPPAPQPPAAPTNLSASAKSATVVDVAWVDASSDETSFELERSSDGGATFTLIATLGAGVTTHTDNTAGPDATQQFENYQYRVRAVGAGGPSAWSDAIGVTPPLVNPPPPPPPPPPPVPTIPAAPTNLQAQVNNGQVALSWTDASDNESSFVVERATSGGAFATLVTLASGATSHTDATVAVGNTYVYRVRAANSAGASTPSNEPSVTIPNPEPEPVDTFTQITWTTRANAPLGKAEALRAVVDGKLYIFAGFASSSGPVVDSDVYDPATNTWSPIKDMPRRLTHAGVAVVGRSVYFAGGYIGIGPGYQQQFGTTEVWRYDVDADEYFAMPALPASRAGGGLVALGNRLHYFSGNNSGRNDVADHYVLDLDNQAAGWTSLAPLPSGRSHMGYTEFAGQIYAIGGQFDNDEELTTTTLVHAYDPATNTWTQRASMPRPISHVSSATFVMGGRILVAGGEVDHEAAIADVYAYDPAANTWTQLTSLPAPRFSGSASAIGDLIYFTGGSAQRTTYRGTPVE